MTTSVLDQDVASAILSFVESGSYPESDTIATYDLTRAIPALLHLVSQAEEDVKVGQIARFFVISLLLIAPIRSPTFVSHPPRLHPASMAGLPRPPLFKRLCPRIAIPLAR